MDAHYDSSQVSPEWHAWLHYMSDKPGRVVTAEFGQPWITPHHQNPSIDRATHYKNPGHWKNDLPRGRVGPKYQAWDPNGRQTSLLRNYSDNSKTLRIE